MINNFLKSFIHVVFAVVNAVLLYLFLLQLPYGLDTFAFSLLNWSEMRPRIEIATAVSLGVAVFALLLVKRLDNEWKSRLIYLHRRFADPGHRNFFGGKNPGFDRKPQLITSPEVRDSAYNPQVQMRVWRRLFKRREKAPLVIGRYRSWLFLLDLYLISLVFLMAFLLAWLLNYGVPVAVALSYVFIYGAQSLILWSFGTGYSMGFWGRVVAPVFAILGFLIVFVGTYKQQGGTFPVVFVGLCFVALGSFIVQVGKKRSQPDAHELLGQDKRKPVLFLRAFYRDEFKIDRPNSDIGLMGIFSTKYHATYTFEEALVAVYEQLGPVVAIGKPGDNLPPLGAARTYASDDEWQVKVFEYADKSGHLVMLLDSTPGVCWELENIVPKFENRNMTLIFPPSRWLDSTELPQEEREKIGEYLEGIGLKMPKANDAFAMCYDDAGKETVLHCKGNTTKRLKLLKQWISDQYVSS